MLHLKSKRNALLYRARLGEFFMSSDGSSGRREANNLTNLNRALNPYFCRYIRVRARIRI